MKKPATKSIRTRDDHGPRHVTLAGRSVFRDLFADAEAEEFGDTLGSPSRPHTLADASDRTQVQAAKTLGVTQARISDIKRGKINQFSLDLLVRLAARAGLHPKMKLAA
jgi:hypothetical protein